MAFTIDKKKKSPFGVSARVTEQKKSRKLPIRVYFNKYYFKYD